MVRMVLMVRMVSGRNFLVGLLLLAFGGTWLGFPPQVFSAQVKSPRKQYAPLPIYTNLPRSKAGLNNFLFRQCLSEPISSSAPVPPEMEVEYGLCKSLDAGSSQFCKTLNNKMSARVCQGRYGLLSFLVMAIKGSPDAISDSECFRGDRDKRGAMGGEQFCSTFVARLRAGRVTINDFCGAGDRSCRESLVFLKGPQACKGLKKEPMQRCMDLAYIVRSHGDPSRCGESLLCRAIFSMASDKCSYWHDQMVKIACSVKVKRLFKGMIRQEAVFRRVNHLPPYKDGDRFLNFLPPQEKEKYYNKKRERFEDRKHLLPRRIPKNVSSPQNSSDSQ